MTRIKTFAQFPDGSLEAFDGKPELPSAVYTVTKDVGYDLLVVLKWGSEKDKQAWIKKEINDGHGSGGDLQYELPL